MSRPTFLIYCLLTLGGCGMREVSLSLKDYSGGTLYFSPSSSTIKQMIFTLYPRDGFSGCATLHGSLSVRVRRRRCKPPSERLSQLSLAIVSAPKLRIVGTVK